MYNLIKNLQKLLFSKDQVSKNTLASVNPEEIHREQIKVEQAENRVTREIEELENQKTLYFNKGISCGSDRQKLQYARKIKELDAQVVSRDRQLNLISRNLRILNGVSQLKENERIIRDLGMEGLVNQMDLSELQEYVEKATIEGQFQMDKFNEVLSSLDSAEGVYQSEDDNTDTLAILEAMNRAADISREDFLVNHQNETESHRCSSILSVEN